MTSFSVSCRSATPLSSAAGGVGSSGLLNVGKGKKAKKKGPLGPISGSKYPKLNFKCTGFWREDHGQVRFYGAELKYELDHF